MRTMATVSWTLASISMSVRSDCRCPTRRALYRFRRGSTAQRPVAPRFAAASGARRRRALEAHHGHVIALRMPGREGVDVRGERRHDSGRTGRRPVDGGHEARVAVHLAASVLRLDDAVGVEHDAVAGIHLVLVL